MGQKMTPEEARRILAEGGFSLTPHPDHEATWMDGLPHDFNGWGPQTPDPDHPTVPMAATDLQWTGEGSTEGHHVWRFELRRRHH
jgi:hypothetical protein